MTELLLFHHAQGLTPGVVGFADELRRGGHTVHTPDLFDGRTFGSIEAGMSYIENDAGFESLVDRAMPWPAGVPAQIHGMDADPRSVDEGDLEAARELADRVEGVDVFLYPGDQHYFADSSLQSYVPEAAALLTQRALAFLDAL